MAKKSNKILITQVRSAINRPSNQKSTLKALGLRGINKSVEHDASLVILGMVNKVKHLVSVQDK